MKPLLAYFFMPALEEKQKKLILIPELFFHKSFLDF